MPRVVVPLDGSSLAETAIPHARAIAAGGRLTLVTTTWDGDGAKPEEYLEAQAAGMRPDDVDVLVIRDREAPDAILLAAEDRPGSTICMATHGRSGLGEAVLGSVAEAVVRTAVKPVLLVGPGAIAPNRSLPVVVAVDGPQTAASVAPAAAELADALSVGIRVVEVVAPPPLPFSPETDTPGWPTDGAGATDAQAALVALGKPAERTILRDVDPAHAILRFVTDLPASFIVMGTHGRRGFARVVLGSVAMRVVHASPCPVLVVVRP